MKTSVVITCYNYGHFIAEAIESVLQQTLSDVEILIIDDGSTDNSGEIAQRYLVDSRVHYFRQDNGGQAKAKNAGIRHSTGEFIAFLDADDRWTPDKLQKQVVLFQDSQVGVVFSRAKYIDKDGDEISFKLTGRWLQPKRGKVTEELFMDNFVPFSSSIVRKECFDRFGTFDETLKMGIDWDLWLRISTGYHFNFVDEPLLEYRMGHSGQMSKNMEERQRCSDRIMESFLANYPSEITPNVLSNAEYYTLCNRGDYFKDLDKIKSYTYYFNALKKSPLSFRAPKSILKNLFNF